MVRAEVEWAMSEGRRTAEALMIDSCTATRPGAPVTDPNTGVVTAPPVTVYPDPAWPADHPWKHGPCRLQAWEAQESNPEAGGATATVQRYRWDVPVGSFAPEIGDVVEMATSVYDPHLVGVKLRVVALLHKSMATAYRLGVEVLDG